MIEKTANRCSLSDGDILFVEGDASDCAYIVETGELRVTTTVNGESVLLAILSEGDIVGEMGIIDMSPRTATVQAIGEAQLIAITRDSLSDRLSDVDPIILFIVRTLVERYRNGLDRFRGKQQGADSRSDGDAFSVGKMRLESELNEALDNDQLELHFQPLVNIDDNTIAGFEALVRWHHPVRGPIAPQDFIALAEETSLIVPIGEYIFERACLALRQFSEASDRTDLFMAINVSGRQVVAPTFIQTINAICQRHGIANRQITIEVTETIAVAPSVLSQWVRRCQALGFRVAIDDFGTGHSGLAMLKRLAPDKVKIDRLFLADVTTDTSSFNLLDSMVQLLSKQTAQIVVEGVESAADLNVLRGLGCHLAQGYWLGKPLPLAVAAQLVAPP